MQHVRLQVPGLRPRGRTLASRTRGLVAGKPMFLVVDVIYWLSKHFWEISNSIIVYELIFRNKKIKGEQF